MGYDGDSYGGIRISVQRAAAPGQGRGNGPQSKTTIDPGPKPDGCNSVVVKGFPFDATKDELTKHFAQCGEGPMHVGILIDKSTGLSRGVARVDFDWEDAAGVDAAMQLNGTSFCGKQLQIKWCAP